MCPECVENVPRCVEHGLGCVENCFQIKGKGVREREREGEREREMERERENVKGNCPLVPECVENGSRVLRGAP